MENNAIDFALFLYKLHEGKNGHSRILGQHIIHWLDYLAKNGHNTLRQDTFLLAKEAAERCVDRASFYFAYIHILMMEHQMLYRYLPP